MRVDKKNPLLCEHLLLKESQVPHRIYLRQPRDGHWLEWTWSETLRQARQVASILIKAGLKRGDRVSIFSKNCAEWIIADFGITLAGMVNVPLFPNQNQPTIEYILAHSEVQLVLIGKLDAHLRTRKYIPEAIKTLNLGHHLDLTTTITWAEVLAEEPLADIVVPQYDEIYTIIYSSGTTGEPKGIVFTHEAVANYLVAVRADLERMVPLDNHHLLSYLPLAHVYERTSVELASLVVDCDVAFVESLDKFAKNLQEIQPTLFTAVPRIWSMFKQRVEQRLAKKKIGWLLKVPVLSRVIKQKIKQQLGLARCQLCVSGAAHLPESVLKFFHSIGLVIQEGCGQTEDFGYTSLSQRHEIRVGYVGTPRFGVQVKATEQGELLVNSPCLMKEYYKEPALTRDSFTENGWLKTGDLVEVDAGNRIKIIGRISENFKNQKGEFVSPSGIEDQFTVNGLIEQCCLVGKLLPSNILLVNLAPEVSKKPETITKEELRKLQHTVNRTLKNHEKISHILVAKETWSIANQCLTPTMKIRRKVLEAKYQDIILNAVNQPVGVVWE